MLEPIILKESEGNRHVPDNILHLSVLGIFPKGWLSICLGYWTIKYLAVLPLH